MDLALDTTEKDSIFADVSPIVGYQLGILINKLDSDEPLCWRSFSDNEPIAQGGFLQCPGMPLGVFFDESAQSGV
jgi:hypothetical protein